MKERQMFSGRSVRGRGVIVLVGLLMGVMPVARAGEEASSFEARFQRVVERLEKMRQENHAPGMAIGVVRGDAAEGEGVLLHAFGLADVEGGRPVTPDTRFAIGSTTKAMTATLIAQLVEQGKMDWDEPVRAHVPGFRLSDPDANEKVTIRDLLCHRAGLASLPSLWYGTEASAEDIVEAVGRAELLHPFREVFEYSNVSYMIAGMAAANGAGAESWHELIREQLLEPLGMAGATTREAEALSDPEQARGYAWDEDTGGLRVLPLRRLDVIAPAGAVNASAREMTHWLRMLLDRGEFEGRRIVGREALEQTWEPQMPAFGVEYALGWLVSEWRGRRMLTHTGGIDGFAAIVVVMPDDDLAYALLINRGGSAVSGLSQHVVLEGMLGELGGEGDGAPAGDAESDGEWARLTGTYVANFGPFTDASFEVLVSDGKLAIDIPGQVTYQLRAPDAEGKRAFVLTDDVKIRFNETEDGEVYSLTLFQAGYRFEAPRKGVEQPKTPVDVAAVRGYLGSYRFDALGVDVEILIERDRLAIDVPGQTTYMLQNADERGRWVFDVKDSIWVEFDEEDGAAPGTLVPSITLVQDGHESVLPRVERAGCEEGVPSADELVDAVRRRSGARPSARCGRCAWSARPARSIRASRLAWNRSRRATGGSAWCRTAVRSGRSSPWRTASAA